jgi:hypothetical protein
VISVFSVVDIPFLDSPSERAGAGLFPRRGALGQPVKEEVGDSRRGRVEILGIAFAILI